MDSPLPEIHRSVLPRKVAQNAGLPLIIYADEMIWVEREDIYYPEKHLLAVILTQPSSIFVCPYNSMATLLQLDWQFREVPGWDFQVRFKERTIYRSDGRISKRPHPTLNWFGFRPHKDKKRGGKRYNAKSDQIQVRVFTVFDPTNYADRLDFKKTYPDLATNLDRYRAFLFELREWCQTNNIRMLPTAGGIAAQFLRDSRFYPEPRRKVPAATNARAREALPGNHYQLFQDISTRKFSALYLDQRSSHHTIASQIALPDSDSLFARGWFRYVPEMKPWLVNGHPGLIRFLESQHGLIFCRLYIRQDSPFLIPKVRGEGWKDVFLFTNELQYLFHHPAVEFAGISAAWTSHNIDSGLRRYANWAIDSVNKAEPQTKAWLKPTLLSAYGMLAAVPRKMEFGMRSDEPNWWFNIGPHRFGVEKITARNHWEPSYVNVIQRGMIEAEARIRSLELAYALSLQGFTILCVYADGIIIEGTTVPDLPDEWAVEAKLTNLEFLTSTRFRSDQISKLPGGPGAKEDRRRAAQRVFHSEGGFTSPNSPKKVYPL